MLTDGTISQHQDYFRDPAGQHKRYNKSCVVVSFHTNGLPDLGKYETDIPVVAVAPHPRFGWSQLLVKWHTGTVTLSRFGIPMDRHGNFLATHVPERPIYYCRVELPDETTVSTDVAATLRKEDLPRTVDGLKKALLKECPHRILKDKYVADLKVYPPGKERGNEQYAKMSTPLAAAPEEAPYHVFVS